jgi:glycosyltransferase involved in cell wall biosynthesis
MTMLATEKTVRDASLAASPDSGADDPELTVIIPIKERVDDVPGTLQEYRSALLQAGVSFEMIVVLDGAYPVVLGQVKALSTPDMPLKIIAMPRAFGEATAIAAGFEHSRGRYILLLPAYRQVDARDLPALIAARDSADMLVANRTPRRDGFANRLQTRVFSALASWISGLKLEDAGCNVRLLKREVLEEVQLYGDFHRFIPMLAYRQGFMIKHQVMAQAASDTNSRIYKPGLYVRRLLDLLTMYFLIRFTKKPFRFFGLIGSALLLVGGIVTAWLIYERLFGETALADRPAFVLGTLLMVFGIQLFSVGLIGEIIIFAHARELKEYSVKEIIE